MPEEVDLNFKGICDLRDYRVPENAALGGTIRSVHGGACSAL